MGIVRLFFLFLKGIYYVWCSAHDMQTKIYESWPNIKNLFPQFTTPFSHFSSIAAPIYLFYLFPYFDLIKLVQHGQNVLIRGNEWQLLLQFKIYIFNVGKVFSVTREINLYEIILIYWLNINIKHFFFIFSVENSTA